MRSIRALLVTVAALAAVPAVAASAATAPAGGPPPRPWRVVSTTCAAGTIRDPYHRQVLGGLAYTDTLESVAAFGGASTVQLVHVTGTHPWARTVVESASFAC